jgi:hypothetical protein
MRSEMCPIVVMPGRARVFRKSATRRLGGRGRQGRARPLPSSRGDDPYGNAGYSGRFRDGRWFGVAWMRQRTQVTAPPSASRGNISEAAQTGERVCRPIGAMPVRGGLFRG